MKEAKLIILLFILITGCANHNQSANIKTVTVSGSNVILSYNQAARDAANEIFDNGGNAFDAFIAATFAEYVIAPGVTSMAGPLSALFFDGKKVSYLDGDFNAVGDPLSNWSLDTKNTGKTVLVPGAVAALELLSIKHGNLSFSEALIPAIHLARDGFIINKTYAAIIKYREEILKRSAYGRKTYFTAKGTPLKKGNLLKLPKVAEFLIELSQNGSNYMYEGNWADLAIKQIKAHGGLMTSKDLRSYSPKIRPSRVIEYKAHRIYSAPGRPIGGIHTMLSLKLLEKASLSKTHYSKSVNDLELLVKISRYVFGIISNLTPTQLDNPMEINKWFSKEYIAKMWDQIQRNPELPKESNIKGMHSFHIIVGDASGNVITGTNTINSLAWGEGIFVQGIPLNAGAKVAIKIQPGERTINDRGMHIVMQDEKFSFATGAFNTSLMTANFQFIVNKLNYDLTLENIVNLPRYGWFPLDFSNLTMNFEKNYLDPRIDPSIVNQLKLRGLYFQQEGFVDTGDGGILIDDNSGSFNGAYSQAIYDE